MPKIVLISNCGIYVYYGDHAPPHFHVEGPDTNVQIDMRTLQVMRGNYRARDLAEALSWAAGNFDVLWAAWRTCNERD